MKNRNIRQNAGIGLRALLAIMFVAFSFCYIYILQSDMLAYLQHVLSHGHTSYNRLIGSIIVIFLVFVIHSAVRSITCLPARLYALTYVPSALFLAVLTDLIASYSLVKLVVYIVLLLLTALFYYIASAVTTSKRTSEQGSTVFISNALILCVIMVAVGLSGNSNDKMHYELKMERLLNEKKYEAVLRVGDKFATSSFRMTCLRAYALAHTGQLGEKMFEYPVISTEKALLIPRSDSTRMIFHPDNIYKYLGAFPGRTSTSYQFLHLLSTQPDLLKTHPQIKDYLLTTALIRKNLDIFASEIKRFYDFSDSTLTLPKHYSEALVLYSHLRTKPVVYYSNNITENNYKDFVEYSEKQTDAKSRTNAIRQHYGDTYWSYYYYGKIYD